MARGAWATVIAVLLMGMLLPAVALAALWTWQGRDQGAIEINQGDEMGRPSTIRLRWGAGRSAIGGAVVKDEVRWLDV